jgi:SAM-dependent MidA family methyltransferase
MQPRRRNLIELPEPDEESAAHSDRVAEYIRQRIKEEGGSISFAEFMQQALYAPGLGYYVSGARKFGSGGDFVTAPEISPLFGQVLARQIATVLQQLDTGSVFELGAGSGVLAATILSKLSALNALPDKYFILEISAELEQRQKEYLESAIPELAARVEWLSEFPAEFSGVIIANEVADALPVERFTKMGGQLKQDRVKAGRIRFNWLQEDAPENLKKAVRDIESGIGCRLPDDYTSEVCLALGPWIADLVRCLRAGLVFVFDYGVTQKEYYAADRHDGWLRCHFQHRAHSNPLILPGIQDLTAWVDFSALANAAIDNGAEIAGFVSQAHFLVNGGLQDELADFQSLDAENQLELSRQIKLLTLPGEMGENFKCIGLSRGDITPPAAFHTYDRTHKL